MNLKTFVALGLALLGVAQAHMLMKEPAPLVAASDLRFPISGSIPYPCHEHIGQAKAPARTYTVGPEYDLM
jgi:hypothetical protein